MPRGRYPRHPYAYVLAKEPHPLGGERNFGDGDIGLDFLGGQRVGISAASGRLYSVPTAELRPASIRHKLI